MSAIKATFIVIAALFTFVTLTMTISALSSTGEAQATEDGYGISAQR